MLFCLDLLFECHERIHTGGLPLLYVIKAREIDLSRRTVVLRLSSTLLFAHLPPKALVQLLLFSLTFSWPS